MLQPFVDDDPDNRVFTHSPDMTADMIWIHIITSSYQRLQNLFTQSHDMVGEVLFTKKRRFSLTKTICAINYSSHLLFAHHITSTKIGDDMKTYDRGFQKELLWLGFPPRLIMHIL